MSTYTAGQNVTFKGQPAVIVKATAPRPDLMGRPVQTLTISTHGGMMTSYIGSLHSELAA